MPGLTHTRAGRHGDRARVEARGGARLDGAVDEGAAVVAAQGAARELRDVRRLRARPRPIGQVLRRHEELGERHRVAALNYEFRAAALLLELGATIRQCRNIVASSVAPP